MTVVLIAVYVPIGFQGGLTGALFTEFAFTLVGAVTVSAVIALTLSRCWHRACCAHTRPAHGLGIAHRRLHRSWFRVVHRRYQRWLAGSLNYLRSPQRSRDHPRQHLFFLHRLLQRAGAGGRPGRDPGLGHIGTECHAGAAPAVRSAGLPGFRRLSGTAHVFQLDVPDRTSPAWC